MDGVGGGSGGQGQDLRLTWVNYSQKLTEALNKFLSRESLCNVTISVNRRSIKAHQAILSACSPWFEEILMENQHPHPIIILKDVRYEDLKNIIKFIYTGEVSVPQHDLQDFLRTAELLEIKGLLRGSTTTAFDHHGGLESPSAASVVTANSNFTAILAPPPPPPQQQHHHHHHQIQQHHVLPSLPTVPVTSIVLGPNPITDGGIDLVSQIKVPVSLSSSSVHPRSNVAASSEANAPGFEITSSAKKRRRTAANAIAKRGGCVQHNLMGGSQQIVHSPPISNANNNSNNNNLVHNAPSTVLLAAAAADDDDDDGGGVTWAMEEEEVVAAANSGQMLTPAQMVANGVSDCGAFKRVWAERYLCYNLGREIICLLCFCRFTQFKKFNLERHMKNKHTQLYNLPELTRKQILDRYVSRYEDHVTPGMVAAVPSHGNENMASEIMAVGPIQLDDLDLDIDLSAAVEAATATGGHEDNDEDDDNDKNENLGTGDDHKLEAELHDVTDSVEIRTHHDDHHHHHRVHSGGSDPLGEEDDDDEGRRRVENDEDDQLIVECQLEEHEGGIVLVKQEKSFSM